MNDAPRPPVVSGEPRLKVVVAGSPPDLVARLADAVRAADPECAVTVGDAAEDALPMTVARVDPDLLLVAEPKAGGETLQSIARLAHAYPAMTPVLVCDATAPGFVMQAMRAGVREMLPSSASAADVADAVGRIRHMRGSRPDRHGQVLAFLSCKGGGGGATLLATNVGYALAAEEGKRVLLLDLNLQWGDAVFFVSDKQPTITLADVAAQIQRVDQAFLSAAVVCPHPRFAVLAAPEDPVHALDVKPEHVDVLVRLGRAHYDFVILDVGRALDPVTVRALDYADAIFPVMQMSLPFVRDGKRLLAAFRALDYPAAKVRPIVNRYERGGDLGLKDMEEALGRPVYRTIPNDYERAAKSVNQGVPLVRLAHASTIARAIREFAHELAQVPAQAAGGWLQRMLGRG